MQVQACDLSCLSRAHGGIHCVHGRHRQHPWRRGSRGLLQFGTKWGSRAATLALGSGSKAYVHPSGAEFPGPVSGSQKRSCFWDRFFASSLFLVPENGPIFGTNFGFLISELIGKADFGSQFWTQMWTIFCIFGERFGDQKMSPKKEPASQVNLKFFLKEHLFCCKYFGSFCGSAVCVSKPSL